MQEEINEVEFKQIVMKKLETGILVKLKAELRCALYNLLENEDEESSSPVKLDLDSLENSTVEERSKNIPNQDQINRLLSEDSCSLALYVVQDLLDALNLSYTSAVFKSETGGISNKYLSKSKDDVLNELNLNLNSGEYKCTPELNGDTSNQSDNESSLNSSTAMKKFDKEQPILLQLLNNYKVSPNNSDIFNNPEVKMNLTTVISTNADNKE